MLISRTAGDGFKIFDLPQPLGRVAIGICMGPSRRDRMEKASPDTLDSQI